MSMRMLIDARHREETRVAVVKGNRVEEFDFESEEHKQLKGNIYLAKVTRVEPSLQAAFVDYGGNRHGFLAFSEIHPDYYQIPKEDRDALLREEAEHAAEEEALRAREMDDDDAEDGAEGGQAEDGDPVRRETLDADEDYDEGDEGEADRPAPQPTSIKSDDQAVESLRQRRMNLRHRYKIQDVIRRRQVLLVQVVKEERGNKGAALTTYLSLAGRYCVLMPNTSHGGGISRKISNAGDRKRLKSIMAELNLPRTMGCIVRTAGLQRTRAEIKRDFDYLARLWDGIRENTLASEAPAEIYRDSDLIKRAIRDIYNKDIDEVVVEGEDGYRAARSFMKLLMPTHARKITPYSDAVPLFQRYGVEDQLAAMYQPVVQLKSGGYLVINPTEALVSIDINSGRSTREHNIEQTAVSTNLEAAHEIARQLRLRDMAGLVVIDFIDMESGGNNRKVERAMKEALKSDRARIQVGRISGFGLFEMSRQRLRTGVLEASTRICPHCEGTGFVRTASSSGLHALRLIEEEAARGRGSQIRLRASQEAALYVLNRKRAELFDVEDRYGVAVEIVTDGTLEGARMTVEAGGPPPAHAPRLPQQIAPEPDDDLVDEIEPDEIEEAYDDEGGRESEPGERREQADSGEGADRRRRRRRRRRGGRREDGEGPIEGSNEEGEAGDGDGDGDGSELAESGVEESADAGDPIAVEGGEERRRRGRRGRRGGRRERGELPAETGEVTAEAPADEVVSADESVEEPPLPAPEVIVAAEVPSDMPKGRRRPRARKVSASSPPLDTDDEAPLATEPEGAAAPIEVAEAPVEPEMEPAPPPRRRSRKVVAEPEAVAEPAAVADSEAAADASLPPARKRRTRKADVAPLQQDPDPSVAQTEAEPEDAADLAVAAVDEVPVESEESEGAPRRGWWQRTFGN